MNLKLKIYFINFVITCLTLATGDYAYAEYQEMLSDGKVWKIRTRFPLGDIEGNQTSDQYFFLEVKGDTIINGEKCKKIYTHTQDNFDKFTGTEVMYTDNYRLAKEIDGRISVYDYVPVGDDPINYYWDWQFMTFIDFGAEEGSEINIDQDRKIKIIKKFRVNVRNREFEVLITNGYGYSKEYPEIWIEGVGTTRMPTFGSRVGYFEQDIVECYSNGELIMDENDIKSLYDYQFLSNVLSISSSNTECQMRYYNLTGLQVTQPVKGNIYICNSKKIKF